MSQRRRSAIFFLALCNFATVWEHHSYNQSQKTSVILSELHIHEQELLTFNMAARGFVTSPETQFSFSCFLVSNPLSFLSSRPSCSLPSLYCPFQSPVSTFSKVRSCLCPWLTPLLPHSHLLLTSLLLFNHLPPLLPRLSSLTVELVSFASDTKTPLFPSLLRLGSPLSFPFPLLPPPSTFSPGAGFGAGGLGFVVLPESQSFQTCLSFASSQLSSRAFAPLTSASPLNRVCKKSNHVFCFLSYPHYSHLKGAWASKYLSMHQNTDTYCFLVSCLQTGGFLNGRLTNQDEALDTTTYSACTLHSVSARVKSVTYQAG